MGGTNQETITGLRMHVSANEVHVHDDSKSLKFSSDAKTFKDDVKEAIKELTSSEGVIRIQGKTKTEFCLAKDGGQIFMFLLDDTNVKSKLQTFIDGI